MKEGTSHYDKDFFTLTYNMQHGDSLGLNPKNIISWQNLNKLIGHHRPLAIDNSTMTELLGDVLSRIEIQKEEIQTLKEKKETRCKN
jgi:flagellar hook-associated protein FlgK